MKTRSYDALSEQHLIEAGDILLSLQFPCWIHFPLFFHMLNVTRMSTG